MQFLLTLDFQIDPIASLLLLPFFFLLFLLNSWKKQFDSPFLFFSSLTLFPQKIPPSFKIKFSNFPKITLISALALFSIAFIDPHYFKEKKIGSSPEKKSLQLEGIAIYLLTDESGSMMETVKAKLGRSQSNEIKKIDLLRQVSIDFINKLPNDLIGLLSFARTADVKAPLTLDHAKVIEEINQLKPSIDEKDGGTAIGYAVYKTVNLILATKHFANDLLEKGKPAYEIKNAIMILITDGVQNVNPQDVDDPFRSMDVSEAANYAKEHEVPLYIINIDPSLLTNDFTAERNLMRRVTKLTGGDFYIADSNHNLSDILEEINGIEKSKIDIQGRGTLSENKTKVSLYPFFLSAGLFFLVLSLLSETTLFKEVP